MRKTYKTNASGQIETVVVGSLAKEPFNNLVTANTNIFATNYTSDRYSKSTIQIKTNAVGILSAVINDEVSMFNSGIALNANCLYEFDLSLLSGLTYNLQFSVNATVQINWQVI